MSGTNKGNAPGNKNKPANKPAAKKADAPEGSSRRAEAVPAAAGPAAASWSEPTRLQVAYAQVIRAANIRVE